MMFDRWGVSFPCNSSRRTPPTASALNQTNRSIHNSIVPCWIHDTRIKITTDSATCITNRRHISINYRVKRKIVLEVSGHSRLLLSHRPIWLYSHVLVSLHHLTVQRLCTEHKWNPIVLPSLGVPGNLLRQQIGVPGASAHPVCG